MSVLAPPSASPRSTPANDGLWLRPLLTQLNFRCAKVSLRRKRRCYFFEAGAAFGFAPVNSR